MVQPSLVMSYSESADGTKSDPCGERERENERVTPDSHTHTATVPVTDDCAAYDLYSGASIEGAGKNQEKPKSEATASDETSHRSSSDISFNNAFTAPLCSAIPYSLNNAKHNHQLPW